jgi:formate dehydrogenase major subunit
MFLTLPKKINKNDRGEVESVTCIRMELGEPDASGRRRPVPVEGSDFTIPVDYILAAIGQKTDVNFIDDINKWAEGGELKINKWGDIDAGKATLQTGIPSVFAAGDGVTGPATIIEAIAQAKIASRSAHQFIMGIPVKPEEKPFTSKKENFRKQIADEYLGRFERQLREEMPVLDPGERMNFREVELGYAGEPTAFHESQRCLECGCTAFFNCDLQKYSSEYHADQKRYEGAFKSYETDFRHPYIEIDNNKCILCSRCVRICREVVGANALGLVNRGFDTYVVPSMGDALQDTPCESCGMCISTCPTGAISENVAFKPGPVKTEPVRTICNYCPVGCEITLNHLNGFVMNVSGSGGVVNRDGNICRFPRFGYAYLNDRSRILKPLRKINGSFEEISFDQALDLITTRIKSVPADENAFFAGARLTNEEMYLIQKLARAAAGTGNLGSFHYLNRGEGYRDNHLLNAPLESVYDASRLYLVGTEINKDHAVAGFMVQNARFMKKIPVVLITEKKMSSMDHKADQLIRVKSCYWFLKAVIHYLFSKKLENKLFLRDRVGQVEEYKTQLLAEDFKSIVSKAGLTAEQVASFAEGYNNELNAIILFSEKEISSNASLELFNLAMITGKLGKTANGLISMKEKNNAQGIFDMGICRRHGVGGSLLDDEAFIARQKDVWKVDHVPGIVSECLKVKLSRKKIRNLFIFGEDPVGCDISQSYSTLIRQVPFKVVQDYFMTGTAKEADIVLPASFPVEIGGTFANMQKVLMNIEPVFPSKTEKTSIDQLTGLLNRFGLNGMHTPKDVFLEAVKLFPEEQKTALSLTYTLDDNPNRSFNYGCDYLVKRFEEEFAEKMKNKNEK